MSYEYKMIPVSSYLGVKEGLDLSETLANLVESIVNKMTEEGWEYYRSDSYTMKECLGCFSALFGKTAAEATYNLLVFRRTKEEILENSSEKKEEIDKKQSDNLNWLKDKNSNQEMQTNDKSTQNLIILLICIIAIIIFFVLTYNAIFSS